MANKRKEQAEGSIPPARKTGSPEVRFSLAEIHDDDMRICGSKHEAEGNAAARNRFGLFWIGYN